MSVELLLNAAGAATAWLAAAAVAVLLLGRLPAAVRRRTRLAASSASLHAARQ